MIFVRCFKTQEAGPQAHLIQRTLLPDGKTVEHVLERFVGETESEVRHFIANNLGRYPVVNEMRWGATLCL